MPVDAVKHDQEKQPYELISLDALESLADVLKYGAKKYSAWNWTINGGLSWMRVFAAAIRHLFAWARGEDYDAESKMPHLAHAMCCIMFLLHYHRNKAVYGKDDRRKRGT